MKILRLLKDYRKLSDADLDLKASTVILALTGNENFPVTSPTLAEFTTVAQTYNTALKGAASRDKNAVAEKREARIALLAAMRFLATNVESLAKGDRIKLVSSGFDLSGDPEPPAFGIPGNFELRDGKNPGEIISSVSRVAGAVAYNHMYTIGPVTENSIWYTIASSKCEVVISGLTSGDRIFVKVVAIGSKDQQACTAILSRLVQ